MTTMLRLLLHLLLALHLHAAHAWRPGSDGRVKWEPRCDFQGHDLLNQQAPGDKCGAICEHVLHCSHWTWTPYLNGTCWLKSGASNRVYASAGVDCGFVVARFKIDTSAGFDLGTGVTSDDSGADNALSIADADAVLRVLNLLRFAHGQPRLDIDARLVLAAKELVQGCPSMHADANAATETVASLPIAARLGFHGTVHQLSLVAPSTSTVAEVFSGWGKEDAHGSASSLLNSDTTIVGFAARHNTTCSAATSEVTASTSSADHKVLTTVYSVLLAKS